MRTDIVCLLIATGIWTFAAGLAAGNGHPGGAVAMLMFAAFIWFAVAIGENESDSNEKQGED